MSAKVAREHGARSTKRKSTAKVRYTVGGKMGKSWIREKKTYCGDHLEVDVYPLNDMQLLAAKGKRSRKEKVTLVKQSELNERHAKRYFAQKLKTNFDSRDLHVTLTYDKQHIPGTVVDAEREARNFLRRVSRLRKKLGLSPLRYMLVTEHSVGDDGAAPVRIHHHIVMSGDMDRDTIEGLWSKRKKGTTREKIGFVNADRLQTENGGLDALGAYLMKQPHGARRGRIGRDQATQGEQLLLDFGDDAERMAGTTPMYDWKKRWVSSQGLKEPQCRTNDHKWSKRALERTVREHPDASQLAKLYPGYELDNSEYAYKAAYSSESGWSMYLKLHKKKQPKGKEAKGNHARANDKGTPEKVLLAC